VGRGGVGLDTCATNGRVFVEAIIHSLPEPNVTRNAWHMSRQVVDRRLVTKREVATILPFHPGPPLFFRRSSTTR
jgi:hypothetical protein